MAPWILFYPATEKNKKWNDKTPYENRPRQRSPGHPHGSKNNVFSLFGYIPIPDHRKLRPQEITRQHAKGEEKLSQVMEVGRSDFHFRHKVFFRKNRKHAKGSQSKIQAAHKEVSAE